MKIVNSDFPRILTLLRKERGIPQKQAAADLGISQALLSHYENGIRECGLGFVVRAAEYYGVSCDYLLGRTPTPALPVTESPSAEKAMAPSADEPPESEIIGAVRMLLTFSRRVGNETLTHRVEGFLSSAVYRMFRKVYRIHPRNEEALFTLPEPRADMRARCQMEEAAAEAEILAKDSCGERLISPEERERAALTTEILSRDYGEDGRAMLRLIRSEEEFLTG